MAVTTDGSSRAAGLRLYVNGEPAAVDVIKDALTREITGGGGDNIALGERFRDRGFKGGAIDEFRVFGRELTPLEALATMRRGRGESRADQRLGQAPNPRASCSDTILATADADYAKQLDALKTARGEVAKFAEGVKEIMVMRELPQPKKAFVALPRRIRSAPRRGRRGHARVR